MSVRFAGSRRVDERRRRNLASQGEPKNAPPSALRVSSKNEQKKNLVPHKSSSSNFPVKKLISRKKWKLSLIGLGLVTLFSFFLYSSIEIQRFPEKWSPDIVKLFSLEDGLLYRNANSLFVFLSAQLTLGIWWARSRSLHDFSGQYRTWFTVSMIGFMVSFCMATDAHIVFANSISWYWDIHFWKQELLGWAVPLLGCATAAVCSMHIELRKNRLSLGMFWFSMLLWGCCLTFSFDAGQEYLGEHFTLAKSASLNLGAIFLFMSLLVHAQFVIYIDADPPVARISLTRRILNRMKLRKAEKLASKEMKEEVRQKKAKAKPVKKSTQFSTRKTTTVKETSTKKTKPVTKSSVTIKEETKTRQTESIAGKSLPSKTTKTRQIQKKQVQQQQKKVAETNPESFNIDDYYFEPGEPLDQELLKGLSKRERRQIRKQWEQSQRAA